jgi:hypothetical protein
VRAHDLFQSSPVAGPLFSSSDREAAVGVEEVQVAGIHSELDPVANADRAKDAGRLADAALDLLGRDGPGQRAARGELDDRIHSIERAMPGEASPRVRPEGSAGCAGGGVGGAECVP